MGSEMCIRDSRQSAQERPAHLRAQQQRMTHHAHTFTIPIDQSDAQPDLTALTQHGVFACCAPASPATHTQLPSSSLTPLLQPSTQQSSSFRAIRSNGPNLHSPLLSPARAGGLSPASVRDGGQPLSRRGDARSWQACSSRFSQPPRWSDRAGNWRVRRPGRALPPYSCCAGCVRRSPKRRSPRRVRLARPPRARALRRAAARGHSRQHAMAAHELRE